jgi:predicted HNH restriction endonuclease
VQVLSRRTTNAQPSQSRRLLPAIFLKYPNDMKKLSLEQYEEAVSTLNERRRTALQELYYLPNSSATAKQLAEIIHPSNPSPITASGLIGKTGKAIADYWDIVPGSYNDGKKARPAYFRLVSDRYYTDIGWTLNDNLKRALENLKLVDNQKEVYLRLTTEILPFSEIELRREGKVVQVFANKFERNQKARRECIKHYGDKCAVCSFDFAVTYGQDIAKGFIHVHHKRELSEIGQEYYVNPIEDLIPLCANCHSAIHLTNPAMSVEDLRRRMKQNGR